MKPFVEAWASIGDFCARNYGAHARETKLVAAVVKSLVPLLDVDSSTLPRVAVPPRVSSLFGAAAAAAAAGHAFTRAQFDLFRTLVGRTNVLVVFLRAIARLSRPAWRCHVDALELALLHCPSEGEHSLVFGGGGDQLT